MLGSRGPAVRKLMIPSISALLPFIFQLPPTKNLRPDAMMSVGMDNLQMRSGLQGDSVFYTAKLQVHLELSLSEWRTPVTLDSD